MSNYTLNIDLSVQGVRKAVEDLGLIARGWNKKAEKVIRLTADDLVDFIYSEYFATGKEGSFDVYVGAYQWANGTRSVEAEGSDLYFLEFGTGIYTEEPPFGYYVDVPVYPGSYSQTVGSGQFRSPDHEYWWYNHHKIEGSLGALAFEKAKDEGQDKIEQHIVEVFG